MGGQQHTPLLLTFSRRLVHFAETLGARLHRHRAFVSLTGASSAGQSQRDAEAPPLPPLTCCHITTSDQESHVIIKQGAGGHPVGPC